LGVNTIRVREVYPNANHQKCMQLLQDADIYVVISLGNLEDEKQQRIYGDRAGSWNYERYNRFTSIIDKFERYPNVLGFIVDSNSSIKHPPIVKAVVRDVKSYIRRMGYRSIPVGIQDAGLEDLQFLGCGDQHEIADFYEFRANSNSRCRNNSLLISNIQVMADTYRNVSIPSYLYSTWPHFFDDCQKSGDYSDVHHIYEGPAVEVFSGGILRSWFASWNEESSKYHVLISFVK
jgi:Glucanosyltransferase